MVSQSDVIYRFGRFEVDSRTGEVRKSGVKIKLQDQPFQVLLKLLYQPGAIVSREELRTALWQEDTFVDFDAGLNTAIRRLRETLGDSAENPTLIETLPRRGYRFIAPVQVIGRPGDSVSTGSGQPQTAAENVSETAEPARATSWYSSWRFILPLGAAALLLTYILLFGAGSSPVTDAGVRFTQITHDGVSKSGPLLSDGTRIYFCELTPAGRVLVQVPAGGGEVTALSTALQNPRLCDLSSDSAEMLLLAGEGEPPLPLWALPVAGGSPRRVGGIQAHAAAWRPDGEELVYANGHDLLMARKDGAGSRRLVTTEGFPSGLCWSPDGKRLRFHVWNPAPASLALWEVAEDGTALKSLDPALSGLESPSSGAWGRAAKTFFFQAVAHNRTDVWAVPPRRWWTPWASPTPVQVTSGPMSFSSPEPNPDDSRELFVLGTAPRAELVRFDPSTSRFLPYLAGISAEGVDFSKDGKWIAFTGYPDGALWRCRADGSQRRRLTFPPVRAFLPRWSPGGASIAFVDISREPWTVRIVTSEGAQTKQVSLPGEGVSDPTWSPTGDQLAFGGVDLIHADEASKFVIRTLDLATGRISTIPGSTGLFSPRWSPDGRHMAAINAESELTILGLADGQKFTVTALKIGFPSWSRQGEFVYFQDRANPEAPGRILRFGLISRKIETVTELEEVGRLPAGTFTSWTGLTPDDSPLLSRDISVQEVYSIRW